MFTVIWCQKSHQGVKSSVEELRWRAVVENPQSANLLTLTQFLQQCSHTPHTINDIVFNGTFAVMEDYVECAKVINRLPNLRRFAMVNAQPALLFLQPNVLWQVTDIAFRACHLNHLPHCVIGMHQLYSIDLSYNYLKNLLELERLNLDRVEMINLTKNAMITVPKAITKMRCITKINLSANMISSIDDEDFKALFRLRELDLSFNSNITVLPSDLILLPSLHHLRITGLVGLKVPTYALAKKGLQHMQKYFEDRNKTGWLGSTAVSAVNKIR